MKSGEARNGKRVAVAQSQSNLHLVEQGYDPPQKGQKVGGSDGELGIGVRN